MNRLEFHVSRIGKGDPDYIAFFDIQMSYPGSSSSSAYGALRHSATFEQVENFRQQLLYIETQLIAGLEDVREMLGELPATSIESAPTAPLFVDEAVS
jgi:hypothetical protein